MSSPAQPLVARLRVAGAVVLCAAAGAGWQIYHRAGNRAALTSPESALGIACKPAASESSEAAIPTRESLAALSPADQITALAAALPQMEVADILSLVEHLLKARDFIPSDPSDPFAGSPDPVAPLLRALFTRWAALDAAGLMAYVESGPLRYDYNTRHLAVLALVEVRGLSALEEVRAKSPSLAHKAALELLLRDPGTLETLLPLLAAGADRVNDGYAEAEALDGRLPPDVLLRFAAGTQNRNAMLNAMNALAATDFARAAALAKSLPGGPVRDMATQWVLNHLSQTTSEYAATRHGLSFRAEYEALPEESPVRKLLTGSYAALLTRENPAAALKWAHTLPDARQRTEALITISGSLFIETKGGNTFLDFYGHGGDAAERIARQLAEAWIAAPPASMEAVAKLHGGQGFAAIFSEWKSIDHAAVERWLPTVTNAELRRALVYRLFHYGDYPKPSFLQLLPDSEARLSYFAITDRYGQPFPDREAATPPGWREAIHIFRMEDSPPSATKWASLTPKERSALAGFVVKCHAEGHLHYYPIEPSATSETVEPQFLQALNGMPSEERSLSAYYETGTAYVKRDETAASQWVDSLPPGAEHDAAATALVEYLVKPGDHQDGEAAFAWAAAMSGETERTRYTAEAARAWAVQDPAAARAAVQTSTLPEAEKSALLRVIPEGGAR